MASNINVTDTGPIEGRENEYQYLPPSPAAVISRTKGDAVPFVERHHFNLDDFEYERNGSNPGKVIVFNHEYFTDATIPPREGTRRDVNEIIMCLTRLGFNIHEEDILRDLTVEEITKKLDSVLEDKQSLRGWNSLIIFVLTHGHKDNQLQAKDRCFNSNEIWTRFNHCPELKDKPKMFIFQACKGKYYTTIDGKETPYNLPDDPSKLLDIGPFTANKLGKNMLLVFSTLEGNVSFRNPIAGSWFIQELCKNFSSYGRRDDVISLITRTIKCVSGNYYQFDEYVNPEYKKQMPIFVSTLSKKFYLNRNKDRHLLLEMKLRQEEIYDMLKDIANRIHK